MMTTTLIPVPQICSQRSPSNSSLESTTPPSPINTRMGDIVNPAPTRTHNGRQRLRPWLTGLVDSGTVKGLEWMNKEKTLFKIPWKHAGKQDYNPEEDSKVFKLWSTNTGKFKEGIHVPEPAVWKTRLRTALNKLPDIEEIQEKTQLDIPEPYRVYKLLPKKPSTANCRRRSPSDGYVTEQQQAYRVRQGPIMPQSAPPYQRCQPGLFDMHGGQYARHNYYGGMSDYDFNAYPTYRRDLPNGHGPLDISSTTADITLTDVEQVIDRHSPSNSTQFSQDLSSCSPPGMYPHHRDVADGGHGHGDETATKIAEAMLTNNNDPIHPNFHDLVPATHPQSMGYPATTKPYSGYNQLRGQEHVYNTTCAPNSMTTNSMTNGGHRLEESPMDMSCQSQESRQSSLDEFPSEQTMMIQVYYRSLNAGSYQVDNPAGCMLYSHQPWEDGRLSGMESIQLPDISDIIDPHTPGINQKTIELTNEVLRCFEKGMSIRCKNGGDIYVTRRCRSVLFWSVSESGVGDEKHIRHDKLEREEEVKVFDLQEFRDRMRQYLRGEKRSPPIPEIYFTVAQKWAGSSEASLHSCLVSIVLTPARAAVELRSVNHDIRTPPKSGHSGMLYFSGADVPTPPDSWGTEWNSHPNYYSSTPSTQVFAMN